MRETTRCTLFFQQAIQITLPRPPEDFADASAPASFAPTRGSRALLACKYGSSNWRLYRLSAPLKTAAAVPWTASAPQHYEAWDDKIRLLGALPPPANAAARRARKA